MTRHVARLQRSIKPRDFDSPTERPELELEPELELGMTLELGMNRAGGVAASGEAVPGFRIDSLGGSSRWGPGPVAGHDRDCREMLPRTLQS